MARTIIQKTITLSFHDFQAIDTSLLSQLHAIPPHNGKSSNSSVLIKLFDAFLRLTKRQLSQQDLNKPSFTKLSGEFYGALNSEVFFEATQSRRYSLCSVFKYILNSLSLNYPAISQPEVIFHHKQIHTSLKVWIDKFESQQLCEETEYLIHGWSTKNKKGKVTYHNLLPIYHTLGREFTDELHKIIATFHSGRKSSNIPVIPPLVKFITQYDEILSPKKFQDMQFMTRFWREFCLYYFQSAHSEGNSVAALIRTWRNNFRFFCEDHLINSGLFSAGFGSFPMPDNKAARNSQTNISSSINGEKVHTKLITHIPLSVTDDEAIEIMFKNIGHDIDLATRYAIHATEDLWRRHQKRIQLAPKGKVYKKNKKSAFIKKESTIQWITDTQNPNYLNNAAATFERHGFIPSSEFKKKYGSQITSIYPAPMTNVMYSLGLPVAGSLIPLLILIAFEQQEVVTDAMLGKPFLSHFKPFDEQGNLTGNLNGGQEHEIVSASGKGHKFKTRRIPINAKTVELIHRLLIITEPAREYMRLSGNKDWRYLFLSCGQGASLPRAIKEFRFPRSNIYSKSLRDYISNKVSIDLRSIDNLELPVLISHKAILDWAEKEADKLWLRANSRKKLASTGIARYVGQKLYFSYEADSVKKWLIDRSNPDYFQNIAANFEEYGFSAEQLGITKNLIYPDPVGTAIHELGIPTLKELFAFCILLVKHHPAITESFLTNLYLHDKNGKFTGLVKSDSAYYLVGYKYRKGSKSAEQKIKLNEHTLKIVKQLIELTSSARKHLKNTNDDSWRRLLIYSEGFSNPRPVTRFDSGAIKESVADGINQICKLSIDKSAEYASRFSLSALRSSMGVLVYIDTQSEEAMSKALGHTAYKPDLLRRYLPKIIQEFFQERWIRVFQQGLICEALKESKYLLKVSRFDSMKELNEFLKNHTLKKTPKHFENPDVNMEDTIEKENSEEGFIAVGVSSGVLSVLLSVELAVKSSTKPDRISGKALYWANISNALVRYIEAEEATDDYKFYLKEAREQATAKKFEGLIYE